LTVIAFSSALRAARCALRETDSPRPTCCRKLIKAARVWLQTRAYTGPCRFDVVAVDAGLAEHIPAAFDASGR